MNGELPAGWTSKPLREVADLCLGKMLDKGKNRGVLRPYLRNINVRWGEFNQSDLMQMRFEESEHERYGVRPGDVVVCEGGEPGRAAVWKDASPMLLQKALHRVRCGPKLNPYFFAYFLRNEAINGDLSAAFTGTTIKHLTGVSLGSYSIPLPSPKDQEAIVARLDDLLGRARRAREALADVPRLLDQFRQSILAAAFRGDLTTAWREAHPDVEPASVLLERVRAERRWRWEAANPRKKYVEPEPVDPEAEGLPELPVGWAWARLEDLGVWTSGGTPSRKCPEYFDGTIPWVKTGDLPDGVVDVVEERITSAGVENSSAKVFPAGTLLIAMYGATIGKLGLLEYPAATNQACAALLPDVNPIAEVSFVFWYLMSARESLRALGQGGAQPNISQTILKKLPIPIAPPIEREVVVRYMNEASAALSRQTNRASHLTVDLANFERSCFSRAFRCELLTPVSSP